MSAFVQEVGPIINGLCNCRYLVIWCSALVSLPRRASKDVWRSSFAQKMQTSADPRKSCGLTCVRYRKLGIKPYRKIAERYDRTAQRTLIKTGLRTGTEAGTTGTV